MDDIVPYMRYLADVACERPVAPVADPRYLGAPALATILAHLGRPDTPITRNGLDAALDILFAHPDIAPVLQTLHPDEFANQVLPHTHPRFADFWTHIVRPAWDQHVALARTLAATAGVSAT
jgi:hypothetical protein